MVDDKFKSHMFFFDKSTPFKERVQKLAEKTIAREISIAETAEVLAGEFPYDETGPEQNLIEIAQHIWEDHSDGFKNIADSDEFLNALKNYTNT